MHARGGMQIEYLSEEWFENIFLGIQEGLKHGMQPWLYDESGWPSGFAGGEVTAKGVYYHAKSLVLDEISDMEAYKKDEHFLGFYKLGPITSEIKRIDEEALISGDLLAVSYTVCPDYIDILNHEVVKVFIECTHERYYERFKEYFGKGL